MIGDAWLTAITRNTASDLVPADFPFGRDSGHPAFRSGLYRDLLCLVELVRVSRFKPDGDSPLKQMHTRRSKAFYAFGFLALTCVVVALTTVSWISPIPRAPILTRACKGDCVDSHDLCVVSRSHRLFS